MLLYSVVSFGLFFFFKIKLLWAVIWDISESLIHILWNLEMEYNLKTCSWKCSYENQYCRWKWENLFRKSTTGYVAVYLRLICVFFLCFGGCFQFPYGQLLSTFMNTSMHLICFLNHPDMREFLLNVHVGGNLPDTCTIFSCRSFFLWNRKNLILKGFLRC